MSDIPESDGTVVTDIHDDLFRDLETLQLAELLDEFSSRAEPLFGCAGQPAKSELADLIRRLTIQVLEDGAAIPPERLWAWVRWLDGHDGYDVGAKERLAEVIRYDRHLRAALLEHVLLTPCGENTWMAAHDLHDMGLDLFPTHEDLAVLLRAARARAGAGPIEEETWRGLLQLGRTSDGISEIVCEAAREAAKDDPALLDVLGRMSEPVPPDWQIERDRREALAEERRQEVFRRHRDAVSQRLGRGRCRRLPRSRGIRRGIPWPLVPPHTRSFGVAGGAD